MRATPGNYPHHPMPETRAQLSFNRTLDEPQYLALIHGKIPRAPDDHWFIFEDDDWVSLHRSATGVCIFKLRLEDAGDEWQVAEAWANRDPDQYNSGDDEADTQMLERLLDQLIESNGR